MYILLFAIANSMLLHSLGLSIFVGLASAYDCSSYNSMVLTDDSVFDKPCSTWTAPNCGNMNEEFIWSNAQCQRDGQFPNGFRLAQLYDNNNPPFVVTIPNSNKRVVRVLIENDNPNQEICVESTDHDETSVGGQGLLPTKCAVGQSNNCFFGPDSGSVQLRFFCTTDCEGEFSFRYKVLTSSRSDNPALQQNSADDSLEMWCMREQLDAEFQAEVQYPTVMAGTKGIPSTISRAPSDEDDTTNGANSLSTSAATFSLFGLIALVVMT